MQLGDKSCSTRPFGWTCRALPRTDGESGDEDEEVAARGERRSRRSVNAGAKLRGFASIIREMAIVFLELLRFAFDWETKQNVKDF
jgi:hypothetical protein